MARIQYEDRLGEYGIPSNFIDETTLDVTSGSTTQVTMQDAAGAGFTVTGVGLDFDLAGNLIAGDFTGFVIFDSSGHTLLSGDRFLVDAMALLTEYNAFGLETAVLGLLTGRDKIIGSNVGDYMMGWKGSDEILGRGGADIILGGPGNNVLSGGGGGDTFVLLSGGNDHILDFQDGAGLPDDMLQVTRRMYRDMVVTDTATGVDIDFGRRGSVSLDGWNAADVGREDFLFA